MRNRILGKCSGHCLYITAWHFEFMLDSKTKEAGVWVSIKSSVRDSGKSTAFLTSGMMLMQQIP